MGSLQGEATKAPAVTAGDRVLRMTGQFLVSSALTWHLKWEVLLQRDMSKLNDNDKGLFSVTQWEAVPRKAPLPP